MDWLDQIEWTEEGNSSWSGSFWRGVLTYKAMMATFSPWSSPSDYSLGKTMLDTPNTFSLFWE